MPKCRAKVRLNRIVSHDYGVQGTTKDYEFHFVYSDKEGSENKKYWEATPTGEFAMRGLKGDNDLGMVAGKEYYLDISEAPTEE